MKNEDPQSAGRYESCATHAAAALLADILFIAEFGLDGNQILHVVALSLFSLSMPLVLPAIIMSTIRIAGATFEASKASWSLGPITNTGILLTGLGIAIAIYTIHWAGVVFLAVGIGISFQFMRRVMGLSGESRT